MKKNLVPRNGLCIVIDTPLTDMTSNTKFDSIITDALFLMEMGIEPRSALKEAAHSAGIPFGKQMGIFVAYAESKLSA